MKYRKKDHYFVVRYVRNPLPGCNWAPRLAFVWNSKGECIQQLSTNSYPLAACNVINWLRHDDTGPLAEWSQITDTGEVELTRKEFDHIQKKILTSEKEV